MGPHARFFVAVGCAALAPAGCVARHRHAPPDAVVQSPAADSDDPPAFAASPAPAAAQPRRVQVGTSVNGAPIVMYLFGPTGEPGATLVIAAIHGNEQPAAFVGRRLVQYLGEDPGAANGKPVAVIPVANPDGVKATTRSNANGVDCNRNFPATNWKRRPRGWTYAGPSPASEPETRAIMAAVEAVRPSRVVSIHSPLQCNNYDGPEPAATLASLMARHNGYPVVSSIGYATPGSFGSWAGADLGVPVVTLELPPRTPGEAAWEQNREALLAVLRH